MNRLLTLVVAFLVVGLMGEAVCAQSANDAYRALKRIQSGVQTGIFYRDYLNVVADARTKVELYLESPESKERPEIAQAISQILGHYDNAAKVWRIQFEQEGRFAAFLKKDSDMAKYIERNYSDYVKFDNKVTGSHKKKTTREFYKKNYLIMSILKYGIWPKASDDLDNLTPYIQYLNTLNTPPK